ncbi:40S ribosomal protein S21 [Dendrobium catenatum]|uniref:40S ribosomal protein S21 n=1 Tax=Dendrobium catenatum TaxID=906689 RepID=A0A2I0VWQ5_9ASPA|nr:40S ribosomal protein S21 [Dendrobium catenatum]
MQNEEGQLVDLYIPRKCSATNRLIAAKDHAAVQINIGHLDEHGVYTRNFTTFALSGFVRAQVVFIILILKPVFLLFMKKSL